MHRSAEPSTHGTYRRCRQSANTYAFGRRAAVRMPALLRLTRRSGSRNSIADERAHVTLVRLGVFDRPVLDRIRRPIAGLDL